MEVIKYKFIGDQKYRYGLLVVETDTKLTIQRGEGTIQFDIQKACLEDFKKVIRQERNKNIKTCLTCKVEKKLEEFAKHSEHSYRSYCIPCYKIFTQRYKKPNPYDPIKYNANKEQILANHNTWRAKKRAERKEAIERGEIPRPRLGRPRKVLQAEHQ